MLIMLLKVHLDILAKSEVLVFQSTTREEPTGKPRVHGTTQL